MLAGKTIAIRKEKTKRWGYFKSKKPKGKKAESIRRPNNKSSRKKTRKKRQAALCRCFKNQSIHNMTLFPALS